MLLCAAAICALVASICIGLLAGNREQELTSFIVVEIESNSASAVVLEIDDNPFSSRAIAADIAEVNAAQGTSDEQLSLGRVSTKPEVPKELYIADAIRLELRNPILRNGAHSDDLAAVETFYDEYNGPALWITKSGISPGGKAVLSEVTDATDWALEPAEFVVPPSDYQPTSATDQAAVEIAISLAILKYARYARGGRVDLSGLSELIDQMPPLRDPKIVLSEIAILEEPGHYLTELHPKHRQFSLLRDALLSARAKQQTEPKEIERILVNIERWRWMPEELGTLHVWLNTPEFMMHVVKGETVIQSEKTVVGKPRYATPIFSASMKSIVFNPKWTVPPTIVKEDLLPKLRKGGGWFGGGSNTAVLKQHRLKVFYRGRRVDPKKINWNKVNMAAISFVQAPGPKNYLGKVKFLYPNKHIVYMHDTTKRGPFKKEVRSEGHHCPRVDNPGTVAAVLLAEDKGWERSKVDELLKNSKDNEVDLDDPIPVHTTYFTAVVGADGQLQTFGDIYKLDDVVAKALIHAKDASQVSLDASASQLPWKTASRESLAVSTP
jgi:murein L,D-transpeptidase YcbB/YkuD